MWMISFSEFAPIYRELKLNIFWCIYDIVVQDKATWLATLFSKFLSVRESETQGLNLLHIFAVHLTIFIYTKIVST